MQLREGGMDGLMNQWPNSQTEWAKLISAISEVLQKEICFFPLPCNCGANGKIFALMRRQVWPAPEQAPGKKEEVWKKMYMGCSQWGFFPLCEMLSCTKCHVVIKTTSVSPTSPKEDGEEGWADARGPGGLLKAKQKHRTSIAAGCWGSVESCGHMPEILCCLRL